MTFAIQSPIFEVAKWTPNRVVDRYHHRAENSRIGTPLSRAADNTPALRDDKRNRWSDSVGLL